jgi:hypothetical protein
MRALVIILSGSLAILATLGGVALNRTHRSNRDLRATNQEIQSEAQVNKALAATLRSERDQLREQVDALKSVISKPQSPASPAGSKAADPDKPASEPVAAPSAYPVPVYVGKSLLGQGWVVPQNLRMNTNTQRYAYDPVVMIDEKFRKAFAYYVTNIVEREVQTYVDNNYYQPVPTEYYAAYPIYPGPGVTNLPRQPIATLPAPKFNSGNNGIMQQKLGIPASAIKTIPSP